jgi:hypothetical protein
MDDQSGVAIDSVNFGSFSDEFFNDPFDTFQR